MTNLTIKGSLYVKLNLSPVLEYISIRGLTVGNIL